MRLVLAVLLVVLSGRTMCLAQSAAQAKDAVGRSHQKKHTPKGKRSRKNLQTSEGTGAAGAGEAELGTRLALQAPGALAATLTGEQLQALPLSGERWQDFVLGGRAGSAQNDAENEPTSRSDRGQPGVTVDGADIRLAFGSAGAGRGGSRGDLLMGPGSTMATVRRVERSRGVAGASGWSGAEGFAGVVTRGGGNKLQGEGSFFSRQNFLGAQNPLTERVQMTAPATATSVPVFTPLPYTAGDRETRWSVGMGGRFRRSRFHWYSALDNARRSNPGVSTVRHPENFYAQPSNDQMQVLSARLGLSSVNPVGEGVAAYSGMLQTLTGLLGSATRASSQWTGFGRVDWAAGERQRFLVEGTGAKQDGPGSGLLRATEFYGTRSYGSRQTGEQWVLGRWEAFVTPHLLAVTEGSYAHHVMTASPESPTPYEQTLNISDWGRLPQINVDTRYGLTIGNSARMSPGSYPDEHLYQAQEQLAWTRGPLLVKWGAEVRHNNDSTTLLRNQTGTYTYSSVENFVSDALSFADFGVNGQLNPYDQHNCDQTGRVWRDTAGTLHGLGYLPCYSHYTQTIGPNHWWLSTTDWAGYGAAQWQASRQVTVSLALRWEREHVPPPIASLNNPELPLTGRVPGPGNEWGPRASLAWGTGRRHWPVLRLGYGAYFGRMRNAELLSVLTQTGSLNGDLKYFIRPTDNLNGGGAPPFPYVLAGKPASAVKPAAVEFAPTFRNPAVQQAVAAVEEELPGRVHLEASEVISLGRHLPVTVDANTDPGVNPQTITYQVVDGNGTGPIKTPQLTVPFFAYWPSTGTTTGFGGRLNPDYQQVTELESRANSTYEAFRLGLVRNGRGGLSVHARYTYAHAMDWNPSESMRATGPSVFDPNDLRQEYGTSNLDVRHAVVVGLVWEPRWQLREMAGRLANGWMLSGVGYMHSGLPYSMRTAGSLAKEFDTAGQAIVALAPGMLGYGGAKFVYGVGRNTFRYPATWKADVRLGKSIRLGHGRQLELLAETYNLFNHQNVTRLETIGYTIEGGTTNGGLPRLTYLTGLKTGHTEFGQALGVNATSFYRQRQIQFGTRFRF
ncbi:MAG TPA: hypothetical protein VMV57_07540 [Terracidiphilus sp.]|nr:hypothetical protein [Terracidiphilus sp.]